MDLALDSPVQFIPRVGPRMATLLSKLGVRTIHDLLTYIPFRYNDYSVVSPASGVRPGETVTVVGTVGRLGTFRSKSGKNMVTARITDASGGIDIVWFNQTYLLKVLHEGDTIHVSGKADWFGNKKVVFNPEYEIMTDGPDASASLHTGRLVPVYPETAGLTSKWLRGRIAYAIESCAVLLSERLPEKILQSEKLMGLEEAVRTIHFPQSLDAAIRARTRLAFDELFLLTIRSSYQKHLWKTTQRARAFRMGDNGLDSFLAGLPFSLTDDQNRAISDILADVRTPTPMNRLLEGDVGSGKTVVAAAGMFASWKNGYSAALLAPTQILAEQHAVTLRTILAEPHGIPVHLITGSSKPRITDAGSPAVFVGTHAMLEPGFPMPDLGLLVIDEQQRFGVNQRATLRKPSDTGVIPHQLIMTATPIPRTIAQTVFGNLDLSVLSSLPSGRQPVRTWVVPSSKRNAAYAWIANELRTHGSRAFIVCPLIEESETLTSVRAVTSEFDQLSRRFSTISLGLLHGRMKPAEKTEALSRLRDGRDSILVTTPVVEVGIDIPDATIIVIEAAERFGLSQLHQLRGRVGRGTKQSYCLLFTEQETPESLARLKALETVQNGPELAALDYRLRGPGELFGTRQHGLPGFALASLSDTELIGRVRRAADLLTASDPSLSEFPYLSEIVRKSTIDIIQS